MLSFSEGHGRRQGHWHISSKEDPADIITKDCLKADYAKHTQRIVEVKLLEIVETVRDNIKNNRLLDGVMDNDLTEYSRHALAYAVNK